MRTEAASGKGIAFPLVRLLIGAVVLLGLMEIARQIPLLQEVAAPWLLFTQAEWVAILIKTGVLGLIILTMQDVTRRLREEIPEAPAVSRLVQLLILFIVLGWAYAIYLTLARALLQDAFYLYQLVLIVAIAAAGIGFVITFLQALNPIASLFLNWVRRVLHLDPLSDQDATD